MIEFVQVVRSSGIVRGVALGFCSALLLAACGAGAGSGSGASGSLEGKYFYPLPGSAGDGMTLELRKDGIAAATRPGGRVQEGTYRVNGDEVTVSLTGDGANLAYTVEADGNLTTLFYGSEKAVFVKQ